MVYVTESFIDDILGVKTIYNSTYDFLCVNFELGFDIEIFNSFKIDCCIWYEMGLHHIFMYMKVAFFANIIY